MGILGKITGKMIEPKKIKEKLANKQFQVGRNLLIKGLPSAIRQGYKEQKKQGIAPTVNSIFDTIELDNLDFYHKMDISSDYIKKVIRETINNIDK